MKNKFLLSISILLCYQFGYSQQEPHYTQNQFNSNLLLNPAYAGSGPCSSIGLRYRNQWSGFEGAPTTFSFIGDTRIASDKLGIGFTCHADNIGITKILTPAINISYHLPVSEKGKLALGFKGGASFIRNDFSKMEGVTNPDPLYAGNKMESIPIIGVGILYYNDMSNIGFSIPTLVSFEKISTRAKILKAHYYLYGGHRFIFDNGLELRPALMARYLPQAPLQFDLGADLWYQSFLGFGVSYRTGDAVDFMIKVKSKKIYLGYSFDMTVSGLSNFNSGTHEIFFGYEFCTGKTKNYPRTDNIRHF